MFESWDNTDRAMRRRMRVYPTLATAVAQHADHSLLGRKLTEEDRRREADRRRQAEARRKAIVSIYGEDLSSEDEIPDGRPDRRKDDKAA